MVEPLGTTTELDPDIPLVAQCHHGLMTGYDYGRCGPRARLLHRFPDGAYKEGRHDADRPATMFPPQAILLWFYFAPWNAQMKARKLQVQTLIPEEDKVLYPNSHHLLDAEQLEDEYQLLAKDAIDLWSVPEYAAVMGAL
jgi:hypothetical protein